MQSSAQPSPTVSHCQSSHLLTGATEHSATDDDNSMLSSMLFEDKNLWSDSFSVLYEFYQSGTFCDVEILVGSQRINCHRIVLACFSQYFRYISQCTFFVVMSDYVVTPLIKVITLSCLRFNVVDIMLASSPSVCQSVCLLHVLSWPARMYLSDIKVYV